MLKSEAARPLRSKRGRRSAFNYPAWNAILLDRQAATPLYEQIFAQIRAAALEHRLQRGSRLPPSRRLAEELNVSRATIVLAYDKLASEGYINRRAGSGAYLEAVLPEDHFPSPGRASEPQQPLPRGPSRRGAKLGRLDLPPERRDRLTLSPGIPALSEFPYDVFAQIAHRRWRDHEAAHTGFDYAHGALELRRQIAAYLAEARGLLCQPEQVIVVGSTVQAASLVAYSLLDRGDVVLTEDPCHLLQSAMFEAWGLDVRALALDADGLDIAAVDISGLHARLAVVTPVGQFPFGSTMTPKRRAALLEWARSGGGWIFEDDFNSEIRWAGRGDPPLAAADPAHVLYASSLNRALAPGLRLAYLVAPLDLVEVLSVAQRTFSLYAPLPDQAIVAEFMAQGRLASHLRRMRGVYRERAAALAETLRAKLEDAFEIGDVEGGLHMTIRARQPIDDVTISRTLLSRGFDCPALSRYYRGRERRSGFILGFGAARPAHIRKFAETFASIVRKAL